MIADELAPTKALLRRLADPASGCGSAENELAVLRELEELMRLAMAASLAATARVDQQGLAHERGYTGAASLLMHALRLAPGEAAQRHRLAVALTPEPQPSGALRPARLRATGEAVQRGDISLAHATVIHRTITDLPAEIEPQLAAGAEAFLAEQARQLNPRQLQDRV